MPVILPRTTSTGLARSAPTRSHSVTPYGISLHAIRNVSGSPPITIAAGIGSPRAWYLSRWMRPCLPGEM
jgi:hypothetical protein